MNKKVFTLVLLTLTLSGCNELMQIASQLPNINTTIPGVVTNNDNISGLKSSLNVGISSAVGLLGQENGFLNNKSLKILFPQEAKAIIDNIKYIPGGEELVNKAVVSLNRSAEDAVKEALPIFKNAITSMSISDATGILFGNDNAATEYLRKTTYTQLKSAFAPKVKLSLDKALVAGVSTSETWNLLTTNYNKAAQSTIGSIAGLKTVNVNIEEYVTNKALDALFVRIAAEEKEIRTNPAARINDILKKVFGQLDKKK